MSKDKLPNQEDITLLSELRSEYSCFDCDEEPYYRALSNAIQALRADENGVDAMKWQYEKSKGEWIITDIGLARCPFCNCERQYPENYCGYCGADLRSEDSV